MLETHPFGIFTPKNPKYVLLGSFTTKEAFDGKTDYHWFYTNGRNKFWPILEKVYDIELKTLSQKQDLFEKLNLALGDIIYQCERVRNSNLDMNLINIVYNTAATEQLLTSHKIEKFFFSSRFVETKFRQVFKTSITKYPTIELITLPSPSTRFAAMKLSEKISRYKDLLPKV